MVEWLIDASAWVIPLILAITLHEAAHGWMAERFGDNTARVLGRVTFNPIKHIDRFGTIIFPALLMIMHSPVMFGYAKPVPVDFGKLNPPRLGMLMVAIAGVMVNFLLALASGILMHIDQWITPEQAPWIFQNLYRSILINCVLIVFNLIPILPLDGGRVVDAVLPNALRRGYHKVEPYGVWIVLLVLLVPAFLGLHVSEQLIGMPAFWLVGQVLFLSGNLETGV